MSTDNADATARLRNLVAGLNGEQRAANLGGGWTVAVALAHLAFWDQRQRLALAAWDPARPPREDELVNEAMEPLLRAVEPTVAARLALEAAEALDREIAAVPAQRLREILDSGHGYIVRRAAHRLEHIQQIEKALGC